MWDKIKEILSLIFGSRLVVELAVLTVLLVVLFGMRVRVAKA